jgi:hypothetical protein
LQERSIQCQMHLPRVSDSTLTVLATLVLIAQAYANLIFTLDH